MGNLFSVQFSFENILIRGWDSIVGQANYVCKLKETLPTFSGALDELKARRNDVQRKVDLDEQRQLRRLDEVQLWLSNAKTIISEAEKLIADGPQEMNNLCLCGYVSKNCLSTYKFGKKVAEMLQDIRDHMSKGVFEKVAETRLVAPVIVRPEERTIALESTIDKVWGCIVGKDVGIIGIYGTGGVGKTTLLTQINNKFNATLKGFDVVIWVLVSKDYDIGKIQDEISEKIGFWDESWNTKSVDQKATDIYGFLLNKRFVLLLDDLWERVDLKKVGIPIPNQENGSKLIFTTRSWVVCGEMEAREKIRVECLKLEDSWNLFRDKVGDETLNSHPDIPELAEQVAKKCGGLPLALITIGRAMASRTNPKEWEYAIQKLKQSAFSKMENEVFPLLKFSYDYLDPTMKCCLLYCCLYPEDYSISRKRLVEYWFCEAMSNEYDSFSEAQTHGESIISSLISACLLERDGEYHVKMHDVIRDMGLWIACQLEAKGESFFVKAGAQLAKEPDVKAWEGAKRMSVMRNQIQFLRETPKCPNLRTMFLMENKLQVIHSGFFLYMTHLTVLNLRGNRGLRALPEGISRLISLECLDLSCTGITELPMELISLTKLKMLDLSDTWYLRKIPRHLISSFSKLQIFRLWYHPSLDSAREDNVLDGVGNEKLIEELRSLQHLNVARLPPIQSKSALRRFLSLDRLRCCTEALSLWRFTGSKNFNVLRLQNMERLESLDITRCGGMKIVMRKLHTKVSPGPFHTLREVSISDCSKLREVTWLILAPNLRSLELRCCWKMEEILSERKLGEVADVVRIPNATPFSKLERLHLENLPELKSIYWDALPFPCLKNISVRECPKLKKLVLNSDSVEWNHITIQGTQD